LLSFFNPRPSSSNGVRDNTNSGSSNAPPSAAAAKSPTNAPIVSPVNSPRNPDGNVRHCPASKFGRAVAL